MSKRLASFAGPSAPSSSPIPAQPTERTPTKSKSGAKSRPKGQNAAPPSPSPLSPGGEPKSPSTQRRPKADVSSPTPGSRGSIYAPNTKSRLDAISESPVQAYVRTALKRVAANLNEWDVIVSRRALKCARAIVDGTTELENSLGMLPEGVQPRSRMLGPRLRELNSKREELKGYFVDLDVVFARIVNLATGLEPAFAKLTERNGIESTERQPIWKETSWSLSRFVLHINRVLRPLHRTKHTLTTLSDLIIEYSLSSGRASQANHPALNSANLQTQQVLLSTTPSTSNSNASPPTFPQARAALASWSSEASRMSESTKEWTDVCVAEVVSWNEIEVASESDGETGLDDL
ncbi:hypothetical protein BDV93DRAFT_546790 [Ceratobasidium sp. AG-I]|nr:hypothetical protein BDV93DRAFT_546790 [Ceratobasidium sp. AG-I]